MNIEDFENSLHSQELNDWFTSNVDNLIIGSRIFPRENRITRAIVDAIGNPNIVTQRATKDILDLKTGDIREAANNGTWQSTEFGPEHIISDYYKRLGEKEKEDFYGLMYLMDIEKLDPKTKFPYEKDIKSIARPFLLQSKFLTEQLLNRLPGKVQIHEPFHKLKSPTESTIVNYDIYVVKMKFNKETALEIYREFNKEDFFKRVGFDFNLLV